ncbi:hypothetical protein GE09DRAFT_1236213 [Coniochaeta sp. 2T2.1]|nr:hypothetical protein GE09DRAFT_1236213 [Coniochaeta sp. 2T2.1]
MLAFRKNRGLRALVLSQHLDQVDGINPQLHNSQYWSDLETINEDETTQFSSALYCPTPVPPTPAPSPALTCTPTLSTDMSPSLSALESWKTAMESTHALLPSPKSRFSHRSELTTRHVCALMNNPHAEWNGQTIFLAHLYQDKINARMMNISEELKVSEDRLLNNPLPCPAGVRQWQWNKRCKAADKREFDGYPPVADEGKGRKESKKIRPIIDEYDDKFVRLDAKIAALKSAQHIRDMRKIARAGLAGPMVVRVGESLN